jgi:hypothetical protein
LQAGNQPYTAGAYSHGGRVSHCQQEPRALLLYQCPGPQICAEAAQACTTLPEPRPIVRYPASAQFHTVVLKPQMDTADLLPRHALPCQSRDKELKNLQLPLVATQSGINDERHWTMRYLIVETNEHYHATAQIKTAKAELHITTT